MRTRLVVVFLVPLIGVLFALGGAYAWSAARSAQQEFFADRSGDVSYFVTSARQSLRSGNATVIEGEAIRYHELYGAKVAVVDRSGTPWIAVGMPSKVLDDETNDRVQLALSGRRGETPQAVLPWLIAETALVEPVFDDGDVIGAVVLSASTDSLRKTIAQQWVILAAASVIAIAAGLLLMNRLASWVLQPVRRVDEAMAAIEQGHMEARIADDTGPPELRRMIELFNRMANEIERVVSRQQEFALTASHELRNPLNALMLRVELLAIELDGEHEEDLEALREEGRRMTQILETLLGLARSGRGESAFAPVDLVELIERRIEAWCQVASDGRVRFELHADHPVDAVTDAIVVESAFDAVVDNALKYAPPGSKIEISVADLQDTFEIEIRDHGPGINREDLDKMTERFWRGEGSEQKPGTGLGLAIASDLLASLGGQLSVDAPPNGGLVVRFQLPKGGAR